MGYRAALLNFSKGELSPELESRFDLPMYQAGLRQALNVKIKRTGGIARRMGTRFVAECISSPVRLIPFQFSDDQAYALEMGQGYMRPLALGGAVLEDGLKITAITKAAHAQITAAFHGYSVGEQVYLKSDDPAAFGMTEILDRWLTVLTVVDASNFAVDIDSTGFTTFGSDVGTVNAGPPPAPPAPPVVPAPLPDPVPPPVTSGGGGRYGDDGGWLCVTTDSMILLSDHSEIEAGRLQAGMSVWTQHEGTLAWGAFPVLAVKVVDDQEVYRVDLDGKTLRATPEHRLFVDGEWRRIKEIGVPDGVASIVKIAVQDAHTYVSNGILSHNIKMLGGD